MCSEKFAKTQIRRLSQLDGFPRDTVAIDELIAALCKARSEEQATGIVSDIISTAVVGSKCPYPADISRMIYDRRPQAEAAKAVVNCSECDDSGLSDSGGEWFFCSCAAGARARQDDPKAAERSNEAAERIRANVARVKRIPGPSQSDLAASRKLLGYLGDL